MGKESLGGRLSALRPLSLEQPSLSGKCVGGRFRTSYNVSIDYLLPARSQAAPSPGVFIGARAKGPVGSDTGMDGIFLAVNSTGFRLVLSVIAVNGSSAPDSQPMLLEGSLPAKAQKAGAAWQTLLLQVHRRTATGLLDGEVLFQQAAIPAPRDHYTGQVAGQKVRGGSVWD
jgi:hypothetical protein